MSASNADRCLIHKLKRIRWSHAREGELLPCLPILSPSLPSLPITVLSRPTSRTRRLLKLESEKLFLPLSFPLCLASLLSCARSTAQKASHLPARRRLQASRIPSPASPHPLARCDLKSGGEAQGSLSCRSNELTGHDMLTRRK
jgi:hypothetical protein